MYIFGEEGRGIGEGAPILTYPIPILHKLLPQSRHSQLLKPLKSVRIRHLQNIHLDPEHILPPLPQLYRHQGIRQHSILPSQLELWPLLVWCLEANVIQPVDLHLST